MQQMFLEKVKLSSVTSDAVSFLLTWLNETWSFLCCGSGHVKSAFKKSERNKTHLQKSLQINNLLKPLR